MGTASDGLYGVRIDMNLRRLGGASEWLGRMMTERCGGGVLKGDVVRMMGLERCDAMWMATVSMV